jgi:hypothetical protein
MVPNPYFYAEINTKKPMHGMMKIKRFRIGICIAISQEEMKKILLAISEILKGQCRLYVSETLKSYSNNWSEKLFDPSCQCGHFIG